MYRAARRFAGLAGLTLSIAAPTRQDGGPSHRVSQIGYTRRQVGEGMYVFEADLEYGALVSGNSTLIIGDSAALVVDSGHYPEVTRRMIAEIKSITPKPVKFLLNTHWHPDHWFGNAEYVRAYPNVQVVSSEATYAAMREQGASFLRQYQDTMLLARLRTLARAPGAPDTSASAADTRAYYAATVPDAEAMLPGWRGMSLVFPTLTFDHRMRVHLGNRDVDLMFLGRANTAGDVVAFDVKTRTLVSGDVVVAPIPYPFGSFFPEWVGVLKAIRDLEPSAIVPGHGPIQHDLRYLDELTGLVAFVRDAAAAAVRSGQSLADFRKATDLTAFENRFARNDPGLHTLFRLDWNEAALKRAYDEAQVNAER